MVIVRTVIALVAVQNWTLFQMDVYTRWQSIYDSTSGFDTQGGTKVCKVHKILIWLKTSLKTKDYSEALLRADFY